MGITFDKIAGSHSNFDMSFWRLFSLEFLWNRYSVTKRSGRLELSKGQNGHNFRSNHGIALKYWHEFLDAVFLGLAMESQLGD